MIKKTVDSVLATFNQALEDLEQIKKDRGVEVGDQREIISSARLQIDAANAHIETANIETGRATRVSKKIKKLIK